MQGAVLRAVFGVGETPTEVEHELPEINRKLSINYFVGTSGGTYGFDLFWHRGGLMVRHTPAFGHPSPRGDGLTHHTDY